ncbi:unnamed protein product [Ambrosiozyma monospora]|uniref:Unnamed protein product n=1 Tax=Ambrosiozyma monospora TaxID=43982 RepID=A0A9W6Z0B2_AMBMO|nr:unnamed protein product [Ambrosiozyma monospora]
MVSKLSFKGDKKSKKKRSRHSSGVSSSHTHHESKKQKTNSTETGVIIEGAEDEANLIMVNNKLVSIEEFTKDQLQEGWTTAVSFNDLNGPLLLTLEREGKIGCLACLNNEKLVVSGIDALELVKPSEVLNFNVNDISFNLEDKLTRVEPTMTSQVFTVVNVENLIKTGDKNELLSLDGQKPKENPVKQVALKNSDGWYLSFDKSINSLTTSQVLTTNEIFNFIASPDQPYKFQITIGLDAESKNKLAVTEDLKVRVILDEENLIDDLNIFTVKVQTRNSKMAKRLSFMLEELNKNDGLAYHDSEKNIKLNTSVKELIRLGIKVDNKLLDKLKRAMDKGRLNEYLVELKEKKLSDRRA